MLKDQYVISVSMGLLIKTKQKWIHPVHSGIMQT